MARQNLEDGELGVNFRAKLNANFLELYGFTSGIQTLTYASSIPTDCTQYARAKVTLLGNATLANPTGLQIGVEYIWLVYQDATGSRTLAYGTLFDWQGAAPTLSTAANSLDIIKAIYDGSYLRAKIDKGW